jgi:hypothetical protein
MWIRELKQEFFFEFYKNLMGSESDEMPEINWSVLYPTVADLHHLSEPFTIEEIIVAINT